MRDTPLDLDCIRDILLCVRENTDFDKSCIFASEKSTTEPKKYQKKLQNRYANDKLMIHVRYCIDADLISEHNSTKNDAPKISHLTPRGYEFLGIIRNDADLEEIKEKMRKIGYFTPDTAFKIAERMVDSAIRKLEFSGKYSAHYYPDTRFRFCRGRKRVSFLHDIQRQSFPNNTVINPQTCKYDCQKSEDNRNHCIRLPSAGKMEKYDRRSLLLYCRMLPSSGR